MRCRPVPLPPFCQTMNVEETCVRFNAGVVELLFLFLPLASIRGAKHRRIVARHLAFSFGVSPFSPLSSLSPLSRFLTHSHTLTLSHSHTLTHSHILTLPLVISSPGFSHPPLRILCYSLFSSILVLYLF